MNPQDWFVDDTGQCQPRPTARPWDLLRENYYLHQFLTEILEIVGHAPNELEEWNYLPQIRQKVRQLVTNSYWLSTQYSSPNPLTGVSITSLYNEIGYPLTIQNVVSKPGIKSSVHNHGTWGIVFQIRGQERHTFWRQVNPYAQSIEIEKVGDYILQPGEMLSLHPEAIHQAETIGTGFSFTFQLYGDTQPQSRFQFEPETKTVKPY